MKFAAIIPLVGCVWNLFLACFVLWHGFRNAAHRVYFFLGLSIAVWNLGGYFLLVGHDPAAGIFWARLLWMGVIFIPLLLFHLSLIIAQLPVPKWVLWAYIAPAALATANTTPLFIERVRPLGEGGLYSVPWAAFPAFNLIFMMVFVSAYVLFKGANGWPAHTMPGWMHSSPHRFASSSSGRTTSCRSSASMNTRARI
jgi:hypothetical protein